LLGQAWLGPAVSENDHPFSGGSPGFDGRWQWV
jgi:hypothetical protein